MHRRGETGFTLVELLVVVLLIGLAAGTAVLALPDARDRVGDEAESLAARLVAARDLAIVSGRDTAVRIDGLGYRFEERGLDGWRPAKARPLQPREWRGGVVVRP
ncbi:MAG: prepilin-type N-terminal cleavage/methylation domain-containing protein, partial [Alphaproteobacteria bacterium]|nr:prepilin-type N-terminal cleavage/methylation domain-containing protein [Alphaproteobacteria bacterium]